MTNSSDTTGETIRLNNPGQLIESIPHLLGFVPTQSAVLVGLAKEGDKLKVGVTSRVDLADLQRASQYLIGVITAALRQGGLNSVGLVLFVEEGQGDPRNDLALRFTVQTAVQQLADAEIQVLEALVANPQRWWSLLCADLACCPPEGTPRVPNGTPMYDPESAVPAPSREQALLRLLRAEEPGLVEDLTKRLPNQPVTPAAERAMTAGLVALAGQLADGRAGLPLSRELLIDSTLALQSLAVRDDIWQLIDARSAGHEQLAEIALQVATRAPLACASPGYFLAGWSDWRAGYGMLAAEAAQRAIEAGGGSYSAAALLVEVISRGLDPRRVPTLATAEQVTPCAHCQQPIRPSTMDPAYPWLHQGTGNAFCDVEGPAGAVANRGLDNRSLAEPGEVSK